MAYRLATAYIATTTVAANGFYQLFGPATGLALGIPVHAWLDNEPSFRAFTFTKASTTNQNIVNLDLYKDRVIVKHEGFTGTSTTNADLNAATNIGRLGSCKPASKAATPQSVAKPSG